MGTRMEQSTLTAELLIYGLEAVAAWPAHFPIEEQGRRSNHGHGLIFNSRQKLDWLSDVLTGTTEEGRIRLLCVDQIFTIPVCHFSTVSCKTKPAAATNVLPLETV